MHQSTLEADTAITPPPPSKQTLALAILAPFGIIALMASPLLFDAARQAFGV